MKTIATLAALLLCSPVFAAEPPKVKNPPAVKGCTFCTDCKCAPGDCPGKCPVNATAEPGTLRTASGRLIRQTATGYVYADEGPRQVLDCSSGKCRWVEAGSPAPVPLMFAPGTAASCPGGKCPSGIVRPAPRFAFPKK